MISAVPGAPLANVVLRTDALWEQMGSAIGGLTRGLDGFDSAAFHRTLDWDLARASAVVSERIDQVHDRDLRALIDHVHLGYVRDVVPVLPSLRQSVIHADLNDYNLLVDARAQQLTGIIDFGDVVYSHTVNEIAIAVAYAMLDAVDPLLTAARLVAGYHAEWPLTEAELSVLFPLACMRLCVSACMAAESQRAQSDNSYLRVSQQPIHRTLPALAVVQPRYAMYVLRDACGLAPVPSSPTVVAWINSHAPSFAPIFGRPFGEKQGDMRATAIDMSAGSPLLSGDAHENGAALLDARIARQLAEHGAEIGVGGYDEPRIIYDWESEPVGAERRTIHLGLDFSGGAGAVLYAPMDGTVHAFENAARHHDYGPVIVLRHETHGADPLTFYSLYGHLSLDSLDQLEVGQQIARGTAFARTGAAPANGDWWTHVHVQLITDMLDVPCNVNGAARASVRSVWRSLSPDPSTFLGVPVALSSPLPTNEQLLSARRAHVGGNVRLSYGNAPLTVVRGWKQYLFNERGQRFVDAYNNVAHVGHSHPRVVRAVAAQLSVLNTNTRYLQSQLTQYAQSLTALLPAPLSVCYFTASGSEANELALRLARAAPGARDVIVMDSAYHGHTTTLIDISPYKHGGAGGSGAPDWVHTVAIPDVYRAQAEIAGEPGAWFAADVERVLERLRARQTNSDLRAGGALLSAFISEVCPSVGGQILPPPSYLGEVYARVRAAGGVCIADEVQTGFGRLGTHFWAFERSGVVPDVVVLGKPIANGFPMGAVVTTPAIARAFDNGMEYFSTFGGSTAACVAAQATLDVTLDEGLQQHALQVGAELLSGFRALAEQHEVVGDVRGSGLFLGVELVKDRLTREPAPDEASFVVARLREQQVLVGTDGPHHNVIKVRGPMCLGSADVESIVRALAGALREMP